jgi:hypothetical protein
LGAADVGATTIPELDLIYHRQINYWLTQPQQAPILFPNQTEQILIDILNAFQKEGRAAYEPGVEFETLRQKLGLLRYFF